MAAENLVYQPDRQGAFNEHGPSQVTLTPVLESS